ncbi:unnamed protein product [Phytophthora fragariaefolia]|uniref:Unnamed protein product n=1 Tax=Phytophthora fragariaefolia TaxID=1490495 RepID=A0A9W6X669_9STRA|nr:unnamed protein product [Phytophthora fragariaefolia]
MVHSATHAKKSGATGARAPRGAALAPAAPVHLLVAGEAGLRQAAPPAGLRGGQGDHTEEPVVRGAAGRHVGHGQVDAGVAAGRQAPAHHGAAHGLGAARAQVVHVQGGEPVRLRVHVPGWRRPVARGGGGDPGGPGRHVGGSPAQEDGAQGVQDAVGSRAGQAGPGAHHVRAAQTVPGRRRRAPEHGRPAHPREETPDVCAVCDLHKQREQTSRKHADRCLIPKIDNTNVDRSIATIQSTLVRVLRKLDRGEKLVDAKIGKFVMLSREHENSIKKAWSSKGVRKAMRPLLKQKVAKRLLLRRLLAEQNTDTFGAPDPHQGEDSSSSEEEDDDDTGREADDERNADDDDEDEQTTVVGSLLSGTNTRDHSSSSGQASPMPPQGQATPTRLAAQKRMFLDEIEEHAAGTSDNAKLMRSLSQAIRQAAVWRASQPLTNYTEWESHVPPPSPEVTFSDVMENMPGFAAAVEKGKRSPWNFEERRKSWMAGDQPADAPKSLAAQMSASRTPPPSASRQFRAFVESQRVEGEAQLQLQRTQQQLQQQQVLPVSHQLPPIGRRTKAIARRVKSLPSEQLQDSSSSLDFDFDSVSMADANEDMEHVSQTSSPRDGFSAEVWSVQNCTENWYSTHMVHMITIPAMNLGSPKYGNANTSSRSKLNPSTEQHTAPAVLLRITSCLGVKALSLENASDMAVHKFCSNTSIYPPRTPTTTSVLPAIKLPAELTA